MSPRARATLYAGVFHGLMVASWLPLVYFRHDPRPGVRLLLVLVGLFVSLAGLGFASLSRRGVVQSGSAHPRMVPSEWASYRSSTYETEYGWLAWEAVAPSWFELHPIPHLEMNPANVQFHGRWSRWWIVAAVVAVWLWLIQPWRTDVWGVGLERSPRPRDADEGAR